MKKQLCQSAFLICFLAGCRASSGYEVPDIAMPCEWHSSTLSNFNTAPTNDLTWWENLNDPTLNELMNYAADQNLDLKIAELQVLEAKGENGSQENLGEVWINISAEIAKNYVELRGLQQRLEIMKRMLAAQAEAVQLTQDLLSRGLINESDYNKIQAEWSTFQGELPPLELNITRIIHRLSTLLGYYPGELCTYLSPKTALPQMPCVLSIGIPSDLLYKRPDIRKAKKEVASVACNKLMAQGALYAYQKKVLEALEESENAIASLNYEQERLRHLKKTYKHSQDQFESAEELHETGVVDNFALIKMKIALLQKEDARVQSHMQILLNYISIYKALGGSGDGWNCCSCSR